MLEGLFISLTEGVHVSHSEHAIFEKLIHVYLIDSLYKPETGNYTGSTPIVKQKVQNGKSTIFNLYSLLFVKIIRFSSLY